MRPLRQLPLLFLSLGAAVSAQSAAPFWTDPATGMLWTQEGGEITWRNAAGYCQGLNYARLTGWRLPSLDELQDIYARQVTTPALSGAVWSSARRIGDRGFPNTESWYFNFSDGTRATAGIDSVPGKHGLCVRLSPEAIARARVASPYWVDPSTGLMWAGQDNGKDVSWNAAISYCHGLRVAGHADWRLASLEELQGVYDKNENALGLAGRHNDEPSTFHVKGNLFLTGTQWSSSRVSDYRGKPADAWLYEFSSLIGRPFKSGDEADNGLNHTTNKRALCVRGPAR